jgi:hypothetical protein
MGIDLEGYNFQSVSRAVIIRPRGRGVKDRRHRLRGFVDMQVYSDYSPATPANLWIHEDTGTRPCQASRCLRAARQR